MNARPAMVGSFILGGVGLAVAAILFFGSVHLFVRTAHVVVFFSESVAGLQVGAPVTLHGVRIGMVKDIEIQFSTRNATERIPVFLELEPKQIRWEDEKLTGSNADFERLVQAGLRAQLAQESFVTGQLRVDLDFRPGTPAQLVGTIPEIPEIPTAPSELGQLRNELSSLPLRELADAAQTAFTSLARLTDHVDTKLDPLIDGINRTADAGTRTLDSADAAVRELRAKASTALRDLDVLLLDARRQVNGRGDELSRTLTSAERAVRKAETLIESLDAMTEPGSPSRGDVEAAIHDLAASASSLRSFAQTLERNPNAIIMGRASR